LTVLRSFIALAATFVLAGCGNPESKTVGAVEARVAAKTRAPAKVTFKSVHLFRQSEDYGVCGLYDAPGATAAAIGDTPFVFVTWAGEESLWAGPDKGQFAKAQVVTPGLDVAWKNCMAKGDLIHK
jgi:hypothetical protein